MPASPMLEAIDLMRVNIDAMDLEELETHARQVLDTLAGLNEYINSPTPRSANARRNSLHQARKLRLHMARVRDLINARKQSAALLSAMQDASSENQACAGRRFAR
jgi:hypothetical protein